MSVCCACTPDKLSDTPTKFSHEVMLCNDLEMEKFSASSDSKVLRDQDFRSS